MYRVTLFRQAFPLLLAAVLAACSAPDVAYDYPDESTERYEKTKGLPARIRGLYHRRDLQKDPG